MHYLLSLLFYLGLNIFVIYLPAYFLHSVLAMLLVEHPLIIRYQEKISAENMAIGKNAPSALPPLLFLCSTHSPTYPEIKGRSPQVKYARSFKKH